MTHPTTFVPLVDRLNREIKVGDTVLAPVRRRTHIGGAKLVEATVERIDPLVVRPGQGTWHSTGPNSKIPLVRESQINHKKPTEFLDYPPETGRHSVITARLTPPAPWRSARQMQGEAISIRYNDCVVTDA